MHDRASSFRTKNDHTRFLLKKKKRKCRFNRLRGLSELLQICLNTLVMFFHLETHDISIVVTIQFSFLFIIRFRFIMLKLSLFFTIYGTYYFYCNIFKHAPKHGRIFPIRRKYTKYKIHKYTKICVFCTKFFGFYLIEKPNRSMTEQHNICTRYIRQQP